jgi:type II secretory pathway pseudopilin PulG
MTLVEILFAFAIVSVVLTLSYASALNAWRSAVAANQRTQAQYLVQQGVESIRAYRESGLDWTAFINDLPHDTNPDSVFHIVMNETGFPSNASSYVCSDPINHTCKFAVVNDFADLNSVGSVGEGGSTTDNTVYRLSIRPVGHFEENNPDVVAGPPFGATNVTAVSFEAMITWTDANGVPSNAVASTIITEP